MNFLFRREPRHIFMTTQDPSYLYTVLCGRCDYPIEATDDLCPRCQSRLEDCPVCRDIRHTRAPWTEPCSKTGCKTCPVCETRRHPFGAQGLGEIEGSFCTNLYGCPAGGLLLKTEEFAVLREDASMCPVCRHENLKPFNLRTFIYLISQCVFCSAVFGGHSSWLPGKWANQEDVTIDRQIVRQRDYSPCPLCGREDTLLEPGAKVPGEDSPPDKELRVKIMSDKPGEPAGTPEPLPDDQYARVVELGKILILENQDRLAAKTMFSSWFNPFNLISPGTSITVEKAGEFLLQGTRKTEIHQILRTRLTALLSSWKEQVPGQGLSYRVSGRTKGDAGKG